MNRYLLFLLVFLVTLFSGCPVRPGDSWLPSDAWADVYIPNDLVVAFPDPIRAHKDVPLDFRFSYYQRDNLPITWTLTNAPAWMTISDGGRVTGTPTATAGAVTVTVKADVGSGTPSFVERSFSITVYDSDLGGANTEIRFVATTGSNAAVGSKAAPWQTIEYALNQVASGNGRLIYVRGGTYTETYTWHEGVTYSPWISKTFTAADYSEIRGYPGETAILDCNYTGNGLWVYGGKYAVLSNLTIKNASRDEKGGLILGYAGVSGDATEDVVAKDMIVFGSDWSNSTNVTGVFMSCKNCWINRIVAYDNKCSGTRGACAGADWNSTNFLFYASGQAGDMYAIDNKSYGSVAGYKMKHAGLKRLILHNGETHSEIYGVLVASAYSSVRYMVAMSGNTGVGALATDVNAYSNGPMLFEHNTSVNARDKAFGIDNAFLTTDAGIIRKNIFYNDVAVAGTGEDDDRLYQIWTYTATATALAYTGTFDKNVFYSGSQNNIVRLGSSAGKDYSWTTWNAAKEANSRFGNPAFVNRAAGNLNLLTSSNAHNIDGTDYAGAFKPGVTYGTVGASTAVLISFDGVPAIVTPTRAVGGGMLLGVG